MSGRMTTRPGPHNVYLHQAGHSHWGLLVIIFVVTLALLILAVGALLVAGKPRPPSDAERPIIPPMRASTAEQILAERLARGEIDAEEYRQRRDALRG
jgi:putative membrane protein